MSARRPPNGSHGTDPRERGQAMVEFSLVAPVLLLVVFGIIQAGIVFGKQLDVTAANREGARRAAVVVDQTTAVQAAKDAVRASMSLSKPTLATTTVTPAPPWSHGDTITVTTTVPHAYSVLGVSSWSGTLRAKTEIRAE